MEHLLSPLIYWNGQEPNFSVETADLSDSQRIELAYWNMNNNEDWELLDAGLQILTQKETAAMQQESTVFPR